jgi:hypothetical protein
MDVIRCLSAGAVAERKTTEFTTAREAACYRRHTHLVTGTQGWTVGAGLEAAAVVQDFQTHLHGSPADKFEILDCHQTAINGPKSKLMQANGLSSQKRPSH